jgi:iron complex outermembrane receptor protein
MAYKDSGSFEMQRSIGLDGTLSDMKWYYDSLKVQVLTTDMAMKWSPDQVTLLNLFKVEYDQHEWSKTFSTNTGSERGYEEETKGIGLRHNAQFGNTLFQAGGQISNSTGLGGNCRSAYNKYDTTVSGWSASVEHTMLDGGLSFDVGYREDTKHIDNSSSGRNQAAANDDANNNVDMAPSKIFAMGAHWQINDTYTFDGRYYRGEQGTTGDFDMRLVDDATPHREKQDRIEAAIAANYTTWFRPILTWFDIDTKNKKSASSTTYELDGGTYYFYTESDEHRRGLELLVKGNILKNTTYSLNWTRMLDIESTSNGVTTDSVGKSRPENLYGMTISHKLDKYRINLSIRRVDSWEDSTTGDDILGGYTRIDANIKRDFNFRDFLLNVAIFGRNLKDENYATIGRSSGYYLDRGRSIGIKFSLAY